MRIDRLFLATAALLASSCLQAAPVVHAGTGLGAGQHLAAFASWQSGVSSFSQDTLAGLAGTSGANANLVSAAGHRFTSTDDGLRGSADYAPVLGTTLELTHNGFVAQFTWTFAQPVDSFGFFAHNTPGVVSIDFTDGSAQHHEIGTSGVLNDTFWGITGLDSRIASVTISSSGFGSGQSDWYRFVTGEARAAVPEPGSLALTLAGLALAAAAARRRRGG